MFRWQNRFNFPNKANYPDSAKARARHDDMAMYLLSCYLRTTPVSETGLCLPARSLISPSND